MTRNFCLFLCFVGINELGKALGARMMFSFSYNRLCLLKVPPSFFNEVTKNQKNLTWNGESSLLDQFHG